MNANPLHLQHHHSIFSLQLFNIHTPIAYLQQHIFAQMKIKMSNMGVSVIVKIVKCSCFIFIKSIHFEKLTMHVTGERFAKKNIVYRVMKSIRFNHFLLFQLFLL